MEDSDGEVKSEVDAANLEYFHRDDYAPLSDLVNTWYLHFGRHHQVFEDALWAHKQERYTLSLPTLAAQVEGILRDLIADRGQGKRWKAHFLKALKHDRKNPPGPTKMEEVPEFMALPAHERWQIYKEQSKYLTLVRVQELFDNKQSLIRMPHLS